MVAEASYGTVWVQHQWRYLSRATDPHRGHCANSLCALGRQYGITCAVVSSPGKHDWPFATQVFDSSLPWLAGQIGTPDVPQIPLPDSVTSPAGTTEVNASR